MDPMAPGFCMGSLSKHETDEVGIFLKEIWGEKPGKDHVAIWGVNGNASQLSIRVTKCALIRIL